MKTISLICILILGISGRCISTTNEKSQAVTASKTVITGFIPDSFTGSGSVLVGANFFNGMKQERFQTPSKNGHFGTVLPIRKFAIFTLTLQAPGKDMYDIYDINNSGDDYLQYIIEEGDSIFVEFKGLMMRGSTMRALTIRAISGTGSEKFHCIDSIQVECKKLIKPKNSELKDWLGFYQHRLQVSQNILQQYRNRISNTAYKLIESQIISKSGLLQFDYLGKYIKHFDSPESLDSARWAYMNLVSKTVQLKADSNNTSASLVQKYLLAKQPFDVLARTGRYYPDSLMLIYSSIQQSYQPFIAQALTSVLLYQRLTYRSLTAQTIVIASKFLSDPGSNVYKNYIRPLYENAITSMRGIPAYDFSLVNTNDKMVKLSDFKGKTIVVDFWFTGCKGCLQTFPILKSAQEQLIKDSSVVFISIAFENNIEQWKQSIATGLYTDEQSVNLMIGKQLSKHPIIERYNIHSYPRIMIIDKNGKIFDANVADKIKDGSNAVKDYIIQATGVS